MSRGPGDRGGSGRGRGLWGDLPGWAIACLVVGTALFMMALGVLWMRSIISIRV